MYRFVSMLGGCVRVFALFRRCCVGGTQLRKCMLGLKGGAGAETTLAALAFHIQLWATPGNSRQFQATPCPRHHRIRVEFAKPKFALRTSPWGERWKPQMLEGFVEQYLLRYLGDYIFGVDKQNLSVTTWRGQIHLRSARLKQEVVELLNLPFKLIFGEAADLKINVPWNRLGSRPVVVELTGLRVLLGPKPATEWSNEEELRRVQLARPCDFV
eukprot:s4872_g1.t1